MCAHHLVEHVELDGELHVVVWVPNPQLGGIEHEVLLYQVVQSPDQRHKVEDHQAARVVIL